MSLTLPVRVRRRVPLALVIAVLSSPLAVVGSLWAVSLHGGPPGEYALFGAAGRSLLTGQWGSVFADKLVQAGPLEVAPYGIARLLSIDSAAGWVAFYSIVSVCLVALYGVSLALSLGETTRRRTELILVAGIALAILSTAVPHAVQSGHIAHLAIPSLWALAGLRARRGDFVTAGLLVAAAAGFETWGVLGVAALLLGDIRRVWRGAVTTIAGVAVLYLPFVVAGGFAMFSMTWGILPHSVLTFVAPELTVMTWPLRLIQGALSVGAGAATAILARRGIEAVWLVPLSVLAFRLAVDPLVFGYYFVAVGLVFISLAAVSSSVERWIPAAVSILFAFVFGTALADSGPLESFTTAGIVLLVIVATAATVDARLMHRVLHGPRVSQ